MVTQMPEYGAPTNLGKLVDVDIRGAWSHEALSFTPWLAANLDRLSEALGLPIELVETERAVGPYFADILATSPRNGANVLIENQLEASDHKHLGQIMTYLAGLEAETVIWIAADFADEHLSAIRWLNLHTVDRFSFFAVKVRAVRIGDSPIAALFDVIEKPNNWDRAVQESSRSAAGYSERGKRNLEFWTYAIARRPNLGAGYEPDALNNRWFRMADTSLVISYYVYMKGVGMFIRGPRGTDRTHTIDVLGPHVEALEASLGAKRDKDFGASLIIKTDDRANWDAMADWLSEKLEFYKSTLTTVLQEAR